MALKFYKCNTCGNIIIKLHDSQMPTECCGKIMEELQPESTDGDKEKHVPKCLVKNNTVCIEVGKIKHPMTKEHHIEFIILETNKGFYVRKFELKECTECIPKACFNLSDGEFSLAAYEYCNIHGIYTCRLCKSENMY